jgi:hypothetical protein
MLRHVAGADDNAGRLQVVPARHAMKDRHLTRPPTGNPHRGMDLAGPVSGDG